MQIAKSEDQSWVADNSGNLLCAKIAEESWDQFGKK
jgi:hypothetical protein